MNLYYYKKIQKNKNWLPKIMKVIFIYIEIMYIYIYNIYIQVWGGGYLYIQNLFCIQIQKYVFDPFARHDLILGGKTLVGNHRGRMFLVVGHQVCTHLWRDFVPLLFADSLQFTKVSRLTFGNSNLQLPPQIFYGIKVWLLLEPLLCCLGRVF